MSDSPTVADFWEQRYRAGHAERYPWDVVVTFVYRNAPRDIPRDKVTIFEVGCGTGSNLWFAAREGFRVAGIDGSESAIEYARRRFAGEKLVGDFRVGDFTKQLPWPDHSFELSIDRGALVCADDEGARVACAEVFRVLKPGGRALFNPYGDSHSSYRSGRTLDNGLTVDITSGSLAGMSARFWSRRDIDRFLTDSNWLVRSVQRLEILDMMGATGAVHAEYRIVVEKPQ